MSSLKPAATSPYTPTDVLTAANSVEEELSDATENRTTTIARIVLNDNGKEVVLEGKEAHAYMLGAQFLDAALPALFLSAMDMLLDPAMLKYFEEGGKHLPPLMPNTQVEELGSLALKVPPQQDVRA